MAVVPLLLQARLVFRNVSGRMNKYLKVPTPTQTLGTVDAQDRFNSPSVHLKVPLTGTTLVQTVGMSLLLVWRFCRLESTHSAMSTSSYPVNLEPKDFRMFHYMYLYAVKQYPGLQGCRSANCYSLDPGLSARVLLWPTCKVTTDLVPIRGLLEPFSFAIGVGKTNAYAHGGEPGWMDACLKVEVTFFSFHKKVAPRFSRNRGLKTEQTKHHLVLLSRLPETLSKVDVVPRAATPRGYHGYPYGVRSIQRVFGAGAPAIGSDDGLRAPGRPHPRFDPTPMATNSVALHSLLVSTTVTCGARSSSPLSLCSCYAVPHMVERPAAVRYASAARFRSRIGCRVGKSTVQRGMPVLGLPAPTSSLSSALFASIGSWEPVPDSAADIEIEIPTMERANMPLVKLLFMRIMALRCRELETSMSKCQGSKVRGPVVPSRSQISSPSYTVHLPIFLRPNEKRKEPHTFFDFPRRLLENLGDLGTWGLLENIEREVCQSASLQGVMDAHSPPILNGPLSRFPPVKNDCPGRRPKIDAQCLLRPFQHLASLVLSLQPYRRDALQSSTIPDLRPPIHEPMQPILLNVPYYRAPACGSFPGNGSSGHRLVDNHRTVLIRNQDSPSFSLLMARITLYLLTQHRHASASKPFVLQPNIHSGTSTDAGSLPPAEKPKPSTSLAIVDSRKLLAQGMPILGLSLAIACPRILLDKRGRCQSQTRCLSEDVVDESNFIDHPTFAHLKTQPATRQFPRTVQNRG
ncbi:uncharacterized protein CLUP02_05736 [Colletotrichum lupini]|uniref:Uncharacterized protein n=1 Tax=Colletotrichum lupini TaxID=145971 RepID=A0A9Q8SMS0_9PEZI|nr:uncharacterized protein CLUP02_05736 [Colletotrichum lupini]UQC80254.1 hypothetical protein CLUP02_05736 [Colletotrichum lupini]